MATYEYSCLACGTPFELRRSIDATVDTVVACPSCRSDRVRRRFSLFATTGSVSSTPSPGSCACGGACACRGH
ncbi:MAG TPA: zinc ribbon domain-containing protein [Actinomycetota bacterium]